MTDVAGLTPEVWQKRLEAAAHDAGALARVLAELEREMQKERTFLHDHPEPGRLFTTILDFLGRPDDDDIAALGEKIRDELRLERRLKERYRSWFPGEDVLDLLFPYLKEFGEPVVPDTGGLQFPGFVKYKGTRRGRTSDMWVFYISERFPGREPANFHVTFVAGSGELILKRIYKKELPRIEGISTASRAVLAEMIRELTALTAIRQVIVDNAANRATREALMSSQPADEGVAFVVRDGADPAKTPLGHLMRELVRELGLVPGTFRVFAQPFGILRLEMDVGAA
jgi:hypothetical protein